MSSGGELELQRNIDKIARDLGWRRFALPTMRKRGAASGVASSKGWPDRVFFRQGRVIVLEFKAEEDFRTSVEQQEWLEEWHKVRELAGFGLIMVAIVRPSDYDDVVRWFA